MDGGKSILASKHLSSIASLYSSISYSELCIVLRMLLLQGDEQRGCSGQLPIVAYYVVHACTLLML
jgi:hypothetical protein